VGHLDLAQDRYPGLSVFNWPGTGVSG